MNYVQSIKRFIPGFVKTALKSSPIPLTKNHKYDLYTKRLLKQYLKPNSNCIDVGCYKGEILDLILKYANEGHHYAFEPVQVNYAKLVEKYERFANVKISSNALSNNIGYSDFQFVKSNPSYSGLKQRKYEREEIIESIEVYTNRLDNEYIQHKIDFIKIDVEGAEKLVIEGGAKLIKKDKPLIVFEHGLGGSELYCKNEELFNLITSLELKVYTFERFFDSQNSLTKNEFKLQFENKLNHYFVASK
jgi:FkbM family methyltransferase